MTRLIVICGATATGKSGLALALAMRLDTVILSADSRQVYREFDIGTAKPTVDEQKLVPHYLIDICDPTETMTVADYQVQAQALILAGDTEDTGDKEDKEAIFLPITPSPYPLIVGGTGLYIRSITQGMKIPRVAPQQELRSQLASLGQMQLYAMLQQVDPVAAAKIHPNDSVRTLRGLEVFYVTGRPISEQQGENPPSYPILQIGLDCDAAHLGDRIARRTEKMIADGLVAEVEYLCQKYGVDLPLLNTLGYQEIKQYLAGDISLDKAKELTILHTRQFAKRQRTWFRASPQIEWFDAECPDLLEKVWRRVDSFIRTSE
ncbi:tRNA (adenosine(37)-N6)-dimethylallyltransferase MiaA [Fischerella thermalis]|uniref:tRNA (adenosine(37)-N6)-dimethylallyltransferase MiaA n=1 Tax=Fischerella thermalis TaxID=372787 RepID=UPI001A01553A|nr:tRNA (adenosine(37)-N6)-dimethylallyltransferase MiaA [Fischerella thermalis]MBF1989759.1 tRNA (adenosine(37)-N6)-dimethylallyltransferase MiaA [Fischerella thermalis M58_A2018_009]MBF2062732.1 tRNA (adenosine(37)-N6)-dimethylallyltransferase MiaA [Fischerella thermalis M66_A2018_004]MBF2068877.1 tRNA (adenosine(37)-N6)-dimethylallyltransferase MiaA [Fischerella thermalis M48_A2018_028]